MASLEGGLANLMLLVMMGPAQRVYPVVAGLDPSATVRAAANMRWVTLADAAADDSAELRADPLQVLGATDADVLGEHPRIGTSRRQRPAPNSAPKR